MMAGLREGLLKHCLCDCELCNRRAECAVVPMYEGGVLSVCGPCLGTLHCFVYGALPPPEYGSSYGQARPEGNFFRGLRESQAKSAPAAMMGMAEKLQEAHDEIERLKGSLIQACEVIEPLMKEFPNGEALGKFIARNAEKIKALP